MGMLRNYLLVAVRGLVRQKAYAGLNVAGLVLGIACAVVILAFLRHELEYERHHERATRIHRLVRDGSATTPPPMAGEFAAMFPRVTPVRIFSTRAVVSRAQHLIRDEIAFVDGTIFDVLTVPLVGTTSHGPLDRPYTAALTRTAARRYFGEADPLGQRLSIDFDGSREYEVTAVIADPPPTTHLRLHILVSMASLEDFHSDLTESRTWHRIHTYLLLPEVGADYYESRLPAFSAHYVRGEEWDPYVLGLQPLTDIHLHSRLREELGRPGDPAHLVAFATIAVLIVLIACINYVNLATARAERRAREIGMRKTLGAGRRQLIQQLLGEAVLQTGAALVLGVALAEAALPAVDAFLGHGLTDSFRYDAVTIAALAILALVVGAVAGGYPALYLSRFQPASVLRGAYSHGRARARLRAILVVVQFAVAIALIAATDAVRRQQAYIQGKDLGFDREHVVVINLVSDASQEGYETLKQRVLTQTGVLSASASTALPGSRLATLGVDVLPDGAVEKKQLYVPVLMADVDFVRTLDLRPQDGTWPAADRPAEGAFIINQAAARVFGWADPVGQEVAYSHLEPRGPVACVVEDFHFRSLHELVEPLIIHSLLPWVSYLSVRVTGADAASALDRIRETWDEQYPHDPFEYSFLDERVDQLYDSERALGGLLAGFSAMAVLISCLGLLGLVAYTLEQRSREVGVRKVLGASAASIATLVARELARLVVVANAVAWPAAYFATHAWLEGFAYRVELGVAPFAAAAVVALAVALATVSFHALRAGRASPIEIIRTE